MVASTITILPIYLDGREKNVLSGALSTFEDDTEVHNTESRTVATTPRSDRVRQNWQLSWSLASSFIVDLFKICRNEKGFLFIPPLVEERRAVAQPIKNTATNLTTGDGSTKTFQLQVMVELDYDIGVGSASTSHDVNYPLAGTVTGYVDGVAAPLDDVDLDSGIITFTTAPGNGLAVTATFERAIPVMFTSQRISRTLLQVDQTEVRSAQIEEIL